MSKSLTVNFKIFYQRKIFLIGLGLGIALIASMATEGRDDAIAGFIFGIGIIGAIIGFMQKEVLCRPISYCLPDQHKLSSKIVIITGIIISLICGTLFSLQYTGDIYSPIISIPCFSVILLAIYLIGPGFFIGSKYSFRIAILSYFLLFYSRIFFKYMDIDGVETLINHGPKLAGVCLIFCIATIISLNSKRLFRRSVDWENSAVNIWNINELAKSTMNRKKNSSAKNKTEPEKENFTTKLLKHSHPIRFGKNFSISK